MLASIGFGPQALKTVLGLVEIIRHTARFPDAFAEGNALEVAL